MPGGYVTAGMAVRFGKLFGNGAGFWLNLQRRYDLAVAERTVDISGIPTLAAWAEPVGEASRSAPAHADTRPA